MDLSETLKTVKSKDKEDEETTKTVLKLAAKKYHLEKELEALKTKASVKRSNVEKLDEELTALSVKVSVLEKQEEIAKSSLRDLVGEVVSKVSEREKIQERFWTGMNNFVAQCNWAMEKKEQPVKNATSTPTSREDKLQLLKLEGKLEAMRLYEKYQSRKIEELKVVKDLLEKDSL